MNKKRFYKKSLVCGVPILKYSCFFYLLWVELEPKTGVVAAFELRLRHLSKKAVTRIAFKNTVAFTLVLLYKKTLTITMSSLKKR